MWLKKVLWKIAIHYSMQIYDFSSLNGNKNIDTSNRLGSYKIIYQDLRLWSFKSIFNVRCWIRILCSIFGLALKVISRSLEWKNEFS